MIISHAITDFNLSCCEQLISHDLVPDFKHLLYTSSTFLSISISSRVDCVVVAGPMLVKQEHAGALLDGLV